MRDVAGLLKFGSMEQSVSEAQRSFDSNFVSAFTFAL